jgi:aerobic carbon-monoxide dehydrogenase medium subunit
MATIGSIGKFEYRAPSSLPEALKILGKKARAAKALAGGTDLVLQMKQGLVKPSLVIDVKQIPELNRLEWSQGGGLHIGAAVSLYRFLTFTGLPETFAVLHQACSLIGSSQIRNRGTLGGNICNAAPSADSAPALLSLGARVVLASGKDTRTIPLEDFFLTPGKTALANDEILVEIEIPTPPEHSAACYLRHTTREEMDISVAGASTFLTLSPKTERLKTARIALGAVAPRPMRARAAEAILTGQKPTPGIIDEAARLAAGETAPISDMRGSAEYRRELAQVLVRRTLTRACAGLGIEV